MPSPRERPEYRRHIVKIVKFKISATKDIFLLIVPIKTRSRDDVNCSSTADDEGAERENLFSVHVLETGAFLSFSEPASLALVAATGAKRDITLELFPTPDG
jgi:hypothetical protein